jgi:TonB family protein
MLMTPSSIVRGAALLAALWGVDPIQAQQDLEIGQFSVRLQTDPITDQDRSFAVLFPRDGMASGMGFVTWWCSETGELLAGVRLTAPVRDDQTQEVVWRFDTDRPDTTLLGSASGATTWFMPEDDAVPFTIRAKTATRLVIRVPGDAPTYRDTDYFYDLTGSANALDRLSCARNPRLLGRRASEAREDTTTLEPGRRTSPESGSMYELSAVEEVPRPLNVEDFRRSLNRNYPPLLRDARVNGTVELRLLVMEDGRVDPQSITITNSSHEQFNDPTIQSVSALRFSPAIVNGRPVRVWITLPIQWTPPS